MKNIYCTTDLQQTPHNGEVDHNNEFVFTCSICGKILKFPSVKSSKELNQLLKDYEAINKPVAEVRKQANQQQAILAEVLEDGTKVSIEESEA
ncbi:MAG TPA: hypothetical protein VH186_06285 [Chloroflexia bacterium]|nr:hypothetical protein [Chloroflexia bacterium]